MRENYYTCCYRRKAFNIPRKKERKKERKKGWSLYWVKCVRITIRAVTTAKRLIFQERKKERKKERKVGHCTGTTVDKKSWVRPLSRSLARQIITGVLFSLALPSVFP